MARGHVCFFPSENLEAVVCSASVSPNDLRSMLDLMADYREAVCQSFCNPASEYRDVECTLTEVCNSLVSYLADVLPPLTAALR